MNRLIEKNEPLTNEEKKLFAYFGENSKILPPFRILNPHRIVIGDKLSIREGAYIHAYEDLSELMKYIEPPYQKDFTLENYQYDSRIVFEGEGLLGRYLLISCTKSVLIEKNVLFSDRIFVGDNNHTFSHPHVPIIQQPNKQGIPVVIGKGSWIGAGVAILAGTKLGQNCAVGANSVVQGEFPSHSVIGVEKAKLLFRRHET